MDKKVMISDNLYGQLKHYRHKTAFVDVNELIEYILQDYLEQKKSNNLGSSSTEENDEIRKRLKNLGYL